MSTTNKKKILILGGGLAGLGAGIQAQKEDHDSLILEANDYAGGLFSNNVVHGCDFDYGPKILVDTPNTKEILKFVGDKVERYGHDEKVYLSEFGILGYPLQRYLYQLPKKEIDKILNSVFEQDKTEKKKINNYKDWLIYNYGEYFSEKILIPYEEKKWNVDLSEMDYQWAQQRQVKVHRKDIIDGAKGPLPQYRWYYYPREGNISSIIDSLVPHAGPVLLNHKITKIDLENRVVEAAGKEFKYDILISTIPMDYLCDIALPFSKKLKKQKDKSLKRLSILIFNLVFKGNHDLDGTAIYFPEKEFTFRRVSVLENLCPALGREGLTPITCEVSVEDITKVDKEKMLKRVLNDLKKVAQFKKLGDPIDHGILEVSFAYPLQTNELFYTVSEISNYLNKYGVYTCGRGGTFNYCDGDLAFRQGTDSVISATKSEKDLVEEQRFMYKDTPVSVTVGIPAYNEEANIANLLESILRQKNHSYTLDKIIVLGDGCTDSTQSIVEEAAKENSKIDYVFDDERLGKQMRLNQLFDTNESDVLVCVDADTVMSDESVISTLINEFDNEKVGLVSGRDKPAPAKNYQEKLGNTIEEMWYEIRKDVNDGDTLHNHRGRLFAISNVVAKKITLPKNVLDDYFIYLWCKENDIEFRYMDEATVYYTPPGNFKEHILQATKVTNSELLTNIGKYIDKNTFKEYRDIPVGNKIKGVAKTFLKAPILTTVSLLLIALDHRVSVKDALHEFGMWKTAESTKKVKFGQHER